MNHQVEKKEYCHWQKLTKKYETHDQLKERDSETKKYRDWRNPWMTTRSEKDIQRLFERSEMDHAIRLTQENILSFSLISEKMQDHQFIQKYLDEITRKNWIWSSSSAMKASLFLVLKSGERRPIVDYWKLNSVTTKDSTTLLLIKNTIDQIQKVQ